MTYKSFAHALVITKSDATVYSPAIRALYIGGAGDVKVDTKAGDVGVIFSAVPVGTILEVACTKVYSAGTTASLIVAMY